MTAIIEGKFRLKHLLREVRDDAGLTQEEFGRAIGVSQGLVSKWERGQGEPTISQLKRIIEVTGADYLADVRELPSPCTPMLAGCAN